METNAARTNEAGGIDFQGIRIAAALLTVIAFVAYQWFEVYEFAGIPTAAVVLGAASVAVFLTPKFVHGAAKILKIRTPIQYESDDDSGGEDGDVIVETPTKVHTD